MMARTAQTIGFSVSPDLKKEIESMIAEDGVSKSSWFRELIEEHKAERRVREFRRITKPLVDQARAMGIYTEDDVMRLLKEN